MAGVNSLIRPTKIADEHVIHASGALLPGRRSCGAGFLLSLLDKRCCRLGPNPTDSQSHIHLRW